MGSNLTADEKTAIQDASTAWDNSVNNQYQFFNFSASSIDEKSNLDAYRDSELGIYKTYDWPDELPGTALAVTQIYGTQRNIGRSSEYIEINHADILLNYDYFSFSTDDSWGYDLSTVVLHEMGHFLGLYHSNTSYESSVMYPTISRYVENRTPKNEDITTLLAKYSSRIGSSSAGQSGAIPNTSSGESKPIVLIFELYPNNKEIIKIKKGDHYEIFSKHNHD